MAKLSDMKKDLLKAGEATAGLSATDIQKKWEQLRDTPKNVNSATPSKPSGDDGSVGDALKQAAKWRNDSKTEPTPAPTPYLKKEAATQAALQNLIATLTPEAPPVVDEAQLIRLIKEHATITHNVNVITPDKPTTTIEGAHQALPELVQWLTTGTHVYLVGPAGSGKTTLAEQAAQALARPFYKQGALVTKHELTGFVVASGEYHTTPFREAYENGGVWLGDEMDSSSPAAMLAINDALSNDSFAFPDYPEPVQRHPDFIAIAAANTIGKGASRQYVGRNPLDGASLDRYVQLEIDYDSGLENRLAVEAFKRYGGQDEKIAKAWVGEVHALRHKARWAQVSVIISPRASINGAKALAVGIEPDKVREATLYKHLSNDQRRALDIEHKG
jgi:cobaltochelatase CobS